MQHLQAEHRQFLQGKQEFLAVHLQQLTITKGHGSAQPAMLWIDQGSNTKGATWSDFLQAIITPIELHFP